MSGSERSPYTFKGPCGHSWECRVDRCTAETLPSCACGHPIGLRPGPCPTCERVPTFLETPLWMHIGIGRFNPAALVKLDIQNPK